MDHSEGQTLKITRQEQDLSLEEASLKTFIKERYLRALEEGDDGVFPSRVQQRGFLRSYAEMLGLDPAPLLEALAPIPGDEERSTHPDQGDEKAESDQQTPGEFEEVGQALQKQRELLGFSLQDVEQQIHINQRYLITLEQGRMDDLPSPVQGRGMLKNYLEFLGLDPEPYLMEFAEQLQARLREKYPDRVSGEPPSQIELTSPTMFQQIFSKHLLVSGVIVIVLLVVVISGSIQVIGNQASPGDITSTIPSVGDVLISSDTPTPTPTTTPTPGEGIVVDIDTGGEEADEPEDVENTPIPPREGVLQIRLEISQRAYVRITVDGEVVFNGRMLPGTVYEYGGDQSIEILTGNAAGVRVTFNEQEIGVLGLFGEVANLVFTEEGILTPTPTITLTPTPSDTPTPTSAVGQ